MSALGERRRQLAMQVTPQQALGNDYMVQRGVRPTWRIRERDREAQVAVRRTKPDDLALPCSRARTRTRQPGLHSAAPLCSCKGQAGLLSLQRGLPRPNARRACALHAWLPGWPM